jgi:diguanylate cyclase (GGDEF)-like protein/putative nucleotidyltransferase with HDIG domain
MPVRAKVFIVITATCGAAVLWMACQNWHSNDLLKFCCYFAIAILASSMKVRFPGMETTMSVSFLFILLGVQELSLGETLVIGCCGALTQSLWNAKKRPEVLKVIFNVLSNTSNAIWFTYFVYHIVEKHITTSMPILLLVASSCYFLGNTVSLSIVIALAECRSARKIWVETYVWGLPYNLAGAAVVGFASFTNHYVGWQNALLIIPVMYVIFRSYSLYLGRLEDQKKRVEIEELQVLAEKRHVEQLCELHMRTIEGLALAISAKDHTTYEHLHRVRTYAIEIGKELGLGEEDLEALRAAALLHDIGKLAVPDHIINKPGRLTPEEFEKMKIHPVVGADILEQVAFPYPVVPIVRSHHEKWNGEGYPDGLKGEEIPISARILAAVDCLDALTSDRQYHKAMPSDVAMLVVAQESGVSFDPKVVEILQRRYRELEDLAGQGLKDARKVSQSARHNAGRSEQPATGFELGFNHRASNDPDFLSSIASARQEAHTLFELSQEIGNSLSLDDTLSLVALRLRKLVPYDSIVTFVRHGDFLLPEFVSGEHFKFFSSLLIPTGEGLCGWVAQNMTPIINGNPAVESGLLAELKMGTDLRSALVVPLEDVNGLVGVLALYRAEPDAFTGDHLRILQVVTSKVAHSIGNALKFRQAEISATNDFLTGLPNARALSIRLDQELARCQREQSTVAVMVCDLNGFKEVNDCHGHLAGDMVLKRFSGLTRDVCRDYDYAARMGGDEFVIVAKNMTRRSVNEKSSLLNSLAHQAGREVCGTDRLSLSVGAAFYPEDGLSTETLLSVADRRMYEAKRIMYEQSAMTAVSERRHSQAVSAR